MNNSTLFKQAHAMTKQVIKQGDCYKTTFGLCLKAIKAQQTSQQLVKNNVVMLFAIVFVMFINKAVKKIKTVKSIVTLDNFMRVMIALPLVAMFLYFLAVIIAYRPIY